MDYRRANRAFMFMIIATLAMTTLWSFWVAVDGREPSILLSNVLCETVVLIPAVAAVLYSGDSLGSVVPLKKFSITSALLSVLYVLALYPLITLVNSISMIFVDNMVDSISDNVLEIPIYITIFSMGVFGPFVEEFVFRGVLFHTYKKTGKILGAVILSSVLFGMMHMNFNQFTYAAVMGVMFSVLVEATGSVWSSFLAHGLFNTLEVIFLYVSSNLLGDAEQIVEGDSFSSLIQTIGVDFLLAVIFTPIALCIVYKIAKIEGRENALMQIIKKKDRAEEPKVSLITFPLIIGIALSIVYMILGAVLT